jgi:hypothetical protein
MSQPEQFRDDVYPSDAYRPEGNRPEVYRPEPVHGDFNGLMETPRTPADREPGGRDLGREPGRDLGRDLGREAGREPIRETTGREAVGRMIGSPLPGTPRPGTPQAGGGAEGIGHRPTPPGRALTAPSTANEDSSAMQRAMGFLKQAAPIVARLLPLIEGNLGAAIGNLFSGRPHGGPTQVTVDLAPVKNQLSDLQAQQTELRSTMQEQTAGLKRVEDRLEMVREATDRNTLEQQELMEDLKVVGHKVNRIALGMSILLLASMIINLYLYYYIKRVLP